MQRLSNMFAAKVGVQVRTGATRALVNKFVTGSGKRNTSFSVFQSQTQQHVKKAAKAWRLMGAAKKAQYAKVARAKNAKRLGARKSVPTKTNGWILYTEKNIPKGKSFGENAVAVKALAQKWRSLSAAEKASYNAKAQARNAARKAFVARIKASNKQAKQAAKAKKAKTAKKGKKTAKK